MSRGRQAGGLRKVSRRHKSFGISTTLYRLYKRGGILAPTTLSACKQSLLARYPFRNPFSGTAYPPRSLLARPCRSHKQIGTETHGATPMRRAVWSLLLKGTMGPRNPLILLDIRGVYGSPMMRPLVAYRTVPSSGENVASGAVMFYGMFYG